MKRLVFLFAIALAAQSVSAQTVTESKLTDNWYVSLYGGMSAKTKGVAVFKRLNPQAGLSIGRNITPEFRLALDETAYFDNSPEMNTGTIIRGINTSLLGRFNLSNLFCGYKGTPRFFEVVALGGLGWGHRFHTASNYVGYTQNNLTSKLALDFDFNLGEAKAWQVFAEPYIAYGLSDNANNNKIAYNINNSCFGLVAGVTYKFGNSNGTHNFTIANLRDQAEIDALNAKVNDLRNTVSSKDQTISGKDKTISDLESQLAAAKNVKPSTIVNKTQLQPTVIFGQGKSNIEPAQYASVAMIAKYLKNHPSSNVLIKGYASPEGSKEINAKLSEARANAVKDALVKKYKISADRLTTKGMGATSELFDEVDFNRVATFSDTSAK